MESWPFVKTSLLSEKWGFPIGGSPLWAENVLIPSKKALFKNQISPKFLSRTQLANFVIGQKYMRI
jgi:hypothetical protein